ncbi:MAG: cytochrome c [Myxococcota bacterium]
MTQKKFLTPFTALVACAIGCGGSDKAEREAAAAADEYALVTQAQEETLERGAMPIDEAMAKLANTPRGELEAIAAAPSADLSAINGWAFAGSTDGAAVAVFMPPECAGAPDPHACWGEKLYGAKGCVACHAIDGERQQPCPNWAGLYGKERPLTTGETVIADDAYIANSIVNSWDQIVEGYGKVMPPYDMPDEEVQALVAYVKSLGSGS